MRISPVKENKVQRANRYLSSLLLTAALAAHIAMTAAAAPQDDRREENRQGENNKRYYDKGHKDYHNWDSNEDRSYQRYQTEHHQKRAFVSVEQPGTERLLELAPQ
jgi:hypothetical protein